MLEPDEQLRPYCRDTAAAMSVACCLARGQSPSPFSQGSDLARRGYIRKQESLTSASLFAVLYTARFWPRH